MPNEEGRAGRSAAWMSLAGLLVACAIPLSMAHFSWSALRILAICVLSGGAIAAAYLGFATIWGWWPVGRLRRRSSAGNGGQTKPGDHQRQPSPQRGRRTWNLPDRNQQFTGREDVLHKLRAHFCDPGKPPVQVVFGPSGAGKTQVAIEYANQFADSYDFGWWIEAESAATLDTQLAALGAEMNWTTPNARNARVARQVLPIVLDELSQASRWLLAFNNADSADAIKDWLPHGGGHVLITSQDTAWQGIARAVQVGRLTRSESVQLLLKMVDRLSATEAGRLAEALGNLPLAVVQAGAYLAEDTTTTEEYLRQLQEHATGVLDKERPRLFPRPLAGAVIMSHERLQANEPAAAELASLCSFFAAEAIPDVLLTAAARQLSVRPTHVEPIASVKHKAIAALVKRSVAVIEQPGLRLHMLTQAILRDHLGDKAARVRERAEAALAAAGPGSPDDPGTWGSWARLLPHVLFAHLEMTADPDLRSLACAACRYLLTRGEFKSARALATRLYDGWRGRLGDDDRDTLTSAHLLASALGELGRYDEAAKLAEDTFRRRGRLFGADNADTLASANDLARYWRYQAKFEAARNLAEQVYRQRQKTLGDNHPDTLATATTLAAIYSSVVSDREAARALNEDIWKRRLKRLGEKHPDTLTSASNFAASLAVTGHLDDAAALAKDTLKLRKRVLGPNHQLTLGGIGESLGETQGRR